MPLYSYRCDTCGSNLAARRSVEDRNDAPPCPVCESPTRRVFEPAGSPLSFIRGTYKETVAREQAD